MTTAAQLITYLKTLPEDTEVSVVEFISSGYAGYAEETPLDIEENTYFVDFNKHGPESIAKLPPHVVGKSFLVLGEK